MRFGVVALYRFVALGDPARLVTEARGACAAADACGTLLVAPEGVNGTLAAPEAGIEGLIGELDRLFGVRQGELKMSAASEKPFARLKVRLKREIITMRAPEADPTVRVGTYVEAKDWNALVDDPGVLVLDTRNRYETRVGTFENALDPAIDSFTEFKDFVTEKLDPATTPRVAMFCTGGIRCEKASAFMLAHGFAEVFHLKGGILRYLKDVPEAQSRWRGDCFVFDNRIALGHGLREAEWNRCFGCGAPLSAEDLDDDAFEAGVSCPHCIGALTPERAAGLRMRQRQLDRAKG